MNDKDSFKCRRFSRKRSKRESRQGDHSLRKKKADNEIIEKLTTINE
jgi:hypothetical protein